MNSHNLTTPHPTNADVPDFDPRRFERQTLLDNLYQWAVLGVISVIVVIEMLMGGGGTTTTVLVFVVFAAWLAMSLADARTASTLPQISAQLGHDPNAAGGLISQGISRTVMNRAVRFELYHRLAILKHTKGDLVQSGAICSALLSQRLGSAERVRPQLLVMLCESRLVVGDYATAYSSLVQLHGCKLSLAEMLQLTGLQTRYEVSMGYDAAALRNVRQRVELSELMPTGPCIALHQTLALAAGRTGRAELSAFLQSRANLLAGRKEPPAVDELTGDPPIVDINPNPATEPTPWNT
ncbi:MAG: hypothetical protein GC164_00700 [Phycisphaera sp.]|nr:hypothetical protein [Phycisphaera sp.]